MNNKIHIVVFISSPSDVAEEREICQEVINECNILLSNLLGAEKKIYFELIKQSDIPSSTDSDPQTAINKYISSNYDIFIGIMWGRYGSPTPRTQSGTVEEYNIAYEKYKRDNNSISILFYFKTMPIAPKYIDGEQISMLQSFKKTISTNGTFYNEFTNKEDLARILRLAIFREAKIWSVRKSIATEESYSHTLTKLDVNSKFIIDARGKISNASMNIISFLEKNTIILQTISVSFANTIEHLDKLTSNYTRIIREHIAYRGTKSKTEIELSTHIVEYSRNLRHEIQIWQEQLPILANNIISITLIMIKYGYNLNNVTYKSWAENNLRFVTSIHSLQSNMSSYSESINKFPSTIRMMMESQSNLLTVHLEANKILQEWINIMREYESLANNQ